METDALIAELAAHATPVKRLWPPCARMLAWVALSLPAVAIIIAVMSTEVRFSQIAWDGQFLVEQAATLATAITAAVAAFCSVVPGYDRRILLLPALPLAIWLASVGHGCVQDWIDHGAGSLALRADWGCLNLALPVGIVPAVAMAAMLGRGAPIFPRTTLVLGTLAVAALANFGLRLFHIGDASIMVLSWHFGVLILLSGFAAVIGPRVFRWRHTHP